MESVEFGSAAATQRVPFNHQLFLSWCGWWPRTDAAECDTHFYVISALGIIYTRGLMSSGADTVCGDIGTAYTGFDNLDFYYLF